MGRALRRHHDQRMKARFYRKQKLSPAWATTDRNAGLYANHGCDCSCPLCGNPRRHYGEMTMQERKQHVPEHRLSRGIHDGDTDKACVWHCDDDDLDAPCEAL